MGEFRIWEIVIIATVIIVKFAVITGVALWSKSNQRKKEAFYRADAERFRLQSEQKTAETNHD